MHKNIKTKISDNYKEVGLKGYIFHRSSDDLHIESH